MPDVPHQLIDRGLVKIVQGHGEFDHAQASGEVPAALTHRFNEVGAQLLGNGRKFGLVEVAQVVGV